ncbi:hypothetical protein G3I59_20555 [Amycolatopsis rubida]|uniref:Uncharacterized protein n=1 Tax=Amycolatopsis rubida TaxID=112413 RepID=A0ABX0BSH7_9PSEU|nr:MULTISPECIES: hypothetical protein [Amycolatopsis]MYW92937.1 hypothetical protein [Amycolatopsis rubida]NEC57924.1 hypothetical protein [Amycolatopsis rubida]OAP21660.1 hypothetical protein A4R44_07683 [Amycolatopsis sp. M39]
MPDGRTFALITPDGVDSEAFDSIVDLVQCNDKGVTRRDTAEPGALGRTSSSISCIAQATPVNVMRELSMVAGPDAAER